MSLSKYQTSVQEAISGLDLRRYYELCSTKDLESFHQVSGNPQGIYFASLNRICFVDTLKQIEEMQSFLRTIGFEDGSLFFEFSKGKGNLHKVKIGFKTGDKQDPKPQKLLFQRALRAHFKGTSFQEVENAGIRGEQHPVQKLNLKHMEQNERTLNHGSVGLVFGVPTFLEEQSRHDKRDHQNIARLMTGMDDGSYQVIQLAKPILQSDIQTILDDYSHKLSVAQSLLDIQISDSMGDSVSQTSGTSQSDTTGTSNTKGANHSKTRSSNQNQSKSSNSKSKSHTNSTGTSTTEQSGTSFSTGDNQSSTTGSSDSYTRGDSHQQTVSTTLKNHKLEQTVKDGEHFVERLKVAKAMGGWHVMTVLVANSPQDLQFLFNLYKSIFQGERDSFPLVLQPLDPNTTNLRNLYKQIATRAMPATPNLMPVSSVLSTKELGLISQFPNETMMGVQISEAVDFGTNLQGSTPDIRIGHLLSRGAKTYHPVYFSKEALTKHMFVTGITGCGKSNTIRQILYEVHKKHNCPFWIIEPAKPEYHKLNVPNLIRVRPGSADYPFSFNPFEYPLELDVYTHIDYITKVFESALGMYGAMPFFFSKAVHHAYEKKGFFKNTTIDARDFPTISDVIQSLHKVLEKEDLQGEYGSNIKAVLIARLESLTMGVKGRIFDNDTTLPHDIEELLTHNVTFDFTAIGDDQERILLIGLLLLRLKQIREKSHRDSDVPLQHVVVMEEAHQLFESKPKGGPHGADKSSSAISLFRNILAEMRTYGQGVIIVDQSPSAVDTQTIKNTNIKIIHRLPDLDDRKSVGYAAGLNEDQIHSLIQQQRGVAVLFNDELQEAVQIHVDEANLKSNDAATARSLPQHQTRPLFRRGRHMLKTSNPAKNDFSIWQDYYMKQSVQIQQTIKYFCIGRNRIALKRLFTPVSTHGGAIHNVLMKLNDQTEDARFLETFIEGHLEHYRKVLIRFCRRHELQEPKEMILYQMLYDIQQAC